MLPAAFNTRMEKLGVGGDTCHSYGGNVPPKCGNLQLYCVYVFVCVPVFLCARAQFAL